MQNYVENYFGKEKIERIESLAQAGSDRKYFRVWVGGNSYIVCESLNVEENKTFFYFTKFFGQHQLPVPKILDSSHDQTIYILEDLGSASLLDMLLKVGPTELVKELYKKSIVALVKMQIVGGKDLDFGKCYAAESFERNAVMADLNYFKYYFLDLNQINYSKARLQVEFESLATHIGNIRPFYFMYRDFQGRNIMIKNDMPGFIDYQGGMKGPLQYDIASLLWQAKAQLPHEWKEELYQFYTSNLSQHLVIEEETFSADYALIVLIRLLQVLGAYGLRGNIERRSHFLSSIPLGLKHLEEWKTQFSLKGYDELDSILRQLIDKSHHAETKQDEVSKDGDDQAIKPELKILVQSFSYKKGIPEDQRGNGGGYVFDCRGILNPGRFDEYKKQTGRDQAVIDFLESKTRVDEFLLHAKELIHISVEDYIQRGFKHLMISFGCTGGQHRSVYCADWMSRYLKDKFQVDVEVHHIEQEAKGWVN